MTARIFLTRIVLVSMIFLADMLSANEAITMLHKNPFIQPIKYSDINSQADRSSDTNASFNELILRGTLSSPDNSIANINGKMLSIGQEINGYEIKKIDIGSAELIKDGVTKLLVVNEKYEKLK